MRPGPGILSLKNHKGAQFYQACVEYYTTLQNVNTTELQEYGYELLEKSQNRFKNLAVQLGYVNNITSTVTFKEAAETLISERNLYFNSEVEVTQVCIYISPRDRSKYFFYKSFVKAS